MWFRDAIHVSQCPIPRTRGVDRASKMCSHIYIAVAPSGREGVLRTWINFNILFHTAGVVNDRRSFTPSEVPSLPRDEPRGERAWYAHPLAEFLRTKGRNPSTSSGRFFIWRRQIKKRRVACAHPQNSLSSSPRKRGTNPTGRHEET
jgi:hypothetical protein